MYAHAGPTHRKSVGFLWIFIRVPYRSEFRRGLVLPTAMLEARFWHFQNSCPGGPRYSKNLMQSEIAWISLKIGGVLYFGVPYTEVALESPNASWLVKTEPNHPAPGNLDGPGRPKNDPKTGLLAWPWAKRDPYDPPTKVGPIGETAKKI